MILGTPRGELGLIFGGILPCLDKVLRDGGFLRLEPLIVFGFEFEPHSRWWDFRLLVGLKPVEIPLLQIVIPSKNAYVEMRGICQGGESDVLCVNTCFGGLISVTTYVLLRVVPDLLRGNHSQCGLQTPRWGKVLRVSTARFP